MQMTLTPKLQLRINQLAEFGTDQEPRLPAEEALRKLKHPAHARRLARLLASEEHSGLSPGDSSGSEPSPLAPRQANGEVSIDKEESSTDDGGAASGSTFDLGPTIG